MQTLLKRWTHALLEWLGLTSATGDALDRWAAFVLVVLAAVVFDLLLQLGIVHGVRKLVERTRAKWDDTLFSVPVLRRMCHILSAILLAVVLPVVFEEKSTGRVIVLRLMQAYIVFSVFRFVNALLYAAFRIAAATQGRPTVLIAHTVKGKGATFAEPSGAHSSQPTKEQWDEAIAAAEKKLAEIKAQ